MPKYVVTVHIAGEQRGHVFLLYVLPTMRECVLIGLILNFVCNIIMIRDL